MYPTPIQLNKATREKVLDIAKEKFPKHKIKWRSNDEEFVDYYYLDFVDTKEKQCCSLHWFEFLASWCYGI